MTTADAPTNSTKSRTMQVSGSLLVSATPEAVYALIADPTRTREWSPENTGARTPRSGPLLAGDHFLGSNSRGPGSWWTESVVTIAEPGSRFAFQVVRWGWPGRMITINNATWDFALRAVDGGTEVTETWTDDRSFPDLVARVFDKIVTGTTFAAFQRRNIDRSLTRLADVLTQSP